MPDPTSIPEGQPTPDPTPAAPDYGASPEVIQQALNMYNGLNNLDTRGQYLQQIVRPEYDGQFLRGLTEQPEQPDPWAQFDPEPQYDQEPQYEPQPFNPRDLQPVFDTQAQEIERRVFERLGQMAQDQAIVDSASSAASAAGLPASTSALIEQRVREAQRMQPNRQAGDLATEAAKALATELLQWKATPPANPAPSSSVPGGPSPDTLQKPRTAAEALEYSRQVLNP